MAAGKDPGNAHFWLSMIKSGVRIVGCLILCNGLFTFLLSKARQANWKIKVKKITQTK